MNAPCDTSSRMAVSLHSGRASFDFAQDEEDLAWPLVTLLELRKTFILSEVEGRTAPIQADGSRSRTS